MARAWTPRTAYSAGERFKFGSVTYKVLESFVSGASFTDSSSKYEVDIQNVNLVNTISEYIKAIPDVLITGGGEDGIAPRLRVDIAQTGFFAGREFRSFKEFDIAADQTYVIKLNVAVNTILFDLNIVLIGGEVKTYTIIGGTEGGSFSDTLPVLPRNYMTDAPEYSPQNTLVGGGTHSGGTVTDLLWVKTDSNNSRAGNTIENIHGERGIAPGTYYYVLTAVGAAKGVIETWWEERP